MHTIRFVSERTILTQISRIRMHKSSRRRHMETVLGDRLPKCWQTALRMPYMEKAFITRLFSYDSKA